MKTQMYLEATGGDLSAGAMCENAVMRPIKPAILPVVKAFLKADANFQIEADINPCSDEAVLAMNMFYAAYEMLIDLGFFESKYDARTAWKITYKEVD